jgi:hypothetical protein
MQKLHRKRNAFDLNVEVREFRASVGISYKLCEFRTGKRIGVLLVTVPHLVWNRAVRANFVSEDRAVLM